MSPEPESATLEQPESMSAVARVTGVFFEPSRTFADIGRRPGWILPLVLLILGSLAFSFFLGQRIGWDRIVRQGFESSSRVQSLSPEQRAAAEKMLDKQVVLASIMAYVGAGVGVPIYYLLVSLVLWGTSSLAGARLRFGQMWAIVCHGMLPTLLSVVSGTVMMYLKPPEEFNLKNPSGFNPGAYIDPNSVSKFVHALLTSLDLFVIWAMVLLAIGIASAGRKISLGTALAAVLLPWALLVLAKASLSGVFG